MTFEIALVLLVLVAAVVLFATERLPVDLVALIVMGTLLLSGIITPQEGISGFSNTATVTVGAMFILSAGLFKTGAVAALGRALGRIARWNFWLGAVVLMTAIAVVSAFINNTAAVAVFMPLVLTLARDIQVSPSKLLMPLSFASMFGGVCTLIGTSTNILVSTIAEQHGLRPFSMFEFAPLGIVMFAAGLVYMLVFGIRLIPNRRPAEGLTQTFAMRDYLTEIVLLPEAKSVGTRLSESPLVEELDMDVFEVLRGGRRLLLPTAETVLQAGDVLRVRCDVEKIRELQDREGIALRPELKWRDEDLESDETLLVEAVVAPNSPLVGKSLAQARFREEYGATVLALRHQGELMHEKLAQIRLRAGDALLAELRRSRLPRLNASNAFVIVSEIEKQEFRKHKVIPALAIIAGVVAAATAGVVPIVVGAILGCVLMVLLRVLTLEEAYDAVEWKVIFLLAGVLTLGVAMDKTGAARLISGWIVVTVGAWGPIALVSAFYLMTSVLTETMSNNATAVLLAPIAIATAESLGVDSRPFLMAVTFAASASFMTPVGYQTNTLIYGPGQYRFADFLRVGTPLNILFWILATFMIPRIWPL
jgi:di/tricarboxylate transporter